MEKSCKKCKRVLPQEAFRPRQGRHANRPQTCEECRDKQLQICLARFPDGKRNCGSCKELLPLDNFIRTDNGNYHSWCKLCCVVNATRRYKEEKTRPEALAKRKAYRLEHRDYMLERDRAGRLLRKIQVWMHYGNGIAACACCGVTEHEFLTLDHIEANGADHRKYLKQQGVGGTATGWFIYKWLIDNNYPEGYQTLCFNCNVGKHRSGINKCPHQIEHERLTAITLVAPALNQAA